MQSLAVDKDAFEATWEDFTAELDAPEWVYRAVANLSHFEVEGDPSVRSLEVVGEPEPIVLPGGVTIRGRSFDELVELGFDEHVLDQVRLDWTGFGASSYVVVTEDEVVKTPNNFIMSNTSSLNTNPARVLGALRLAASGDVRYGTTWFARPGRFNVGLGGVTSTGGVPDTIGTTYRFSPSLLDRVAVLYGHLQTLEQAGYQRGPGNLELGLRSFMATYDRWPWGYDSQLLDSITALEAVLGTDTEIAFRLAFRVSHILGADEDEIGEIFDQVKGYYATRSRVVHGGQLKERDRLRLQAVDDLRGIVRRLLGGFVHLAASDDHPFDREFFERRLDGALIRSADRVSLRSQMGFSDEDETHR